MEKNIYTLHAYEKQGNAYKFVEIDRVEYALIAKNRAKWLSSQRRQNVTVYKNGIPYGFVEYPIYLRNLQLDQKELHFYKYKI